jgi:SNF2 family DNA or RNA helicase
MERQLAELLAKAGIPAARLTGSASARSNSLTTFQNKEGPRVLLLNITDERAAGANLTMANHVFFLHPYIEQDNHKQHAALTQAIGRVCRHGQTRCVKIKTFYTAKTIEERWTCV